MPHILLQISSSSAHFHAYLASKRGTNISRKNFYNKNQWYIIISTLGPSGERTVSVTRSLTKPAPATVHSVVSD